MLPSKCGDVYCASARGIGRYSANRQMSRLVAFAATINISIVRASNGFNFGLKFRIQLLCIFPPLNWQSRDVHDVDRSSRVPDPPPELRISMHYF
jgi:hypothetical protein